MKIKIKRITYYTFNPPFTVLSGICFNYHIDNCRYLTGVAIGSLVCSWCSWRWFRIGNYVVCKIRGKR
jgi:hypothetical protein